MPVAAPSQPTNTPLPVLRTALDRDEVLKRLEQAWRRGKLPGFAPGGPGLFCAEAFANPFPSDLIASATDADGALELRFTTRIVWKMPTFFAVVLILTLWPGLPMTESMLNTYWASSKDWIPMWWWYVPMWVLSLPWMWTSTKKSRKGVVPEAHKAIEAIAKAIDGELVKA